MIELKNIYKKIKGKDIITNFNYKFEEGKVYLLTGHNGCGKTMLLRLICGLISPDSGEVINGKLRYGVMIENPTFMNSETALYNLKYLANINKLINDECILEHLKKVNLLEDKNTVVKKFSLGMKQRLALAQALMENPEVLLLDEPFNALDDDNLIRVNKLIEDEKKKKKVIVIAAHGYNDLFGIVDHELKLSNGKLVKAN